MPPPYTFAPLELLLASDTLLAVDVNDDAVQRVNVLLATEKMLLLTVVSPMNRLLRLTPL